jgi:hypothetical protein
MSEIKYALDFSVVRLVLIQAWQSILADSR